MADDKRTRSYVPVQVTHGDKTQSLDEWAAETGIARHTLYYRIVRLGWDVQRALSIKPRRESHGLRRVAEYGVWNMMIQRCTNPRNRSYKNYGGRGIEVCERWLGSFGNFYADMGPRPSNKYSIERIDNNKPYGPDNCRWATMNEQARNRSNNHFVDFDGERKTIAEWSEITGLTPHLIHQRISLGWDIRRALTTPCRVLKRRSIA